MTSLFYRLHRLVVMLAFSPLIQLAVAQGYPTIVAPISTHVPSACTLDESSLTNSGTSSAGLSSSSGTVVARCGIANPMNSGQPQWNRLLVTYQDPDGTGTTYTVRVRLRRVNYATGVTATIATFDSNTVSLSAQAITLDEIAFSHVFDFYNHSYFLELTLTRPATPGTAPAVFLVRLAQIVFIPTGQP